MKKVISTLFLLFLCFISYSQTDSQTESQGVLKTEEVEIFFEHNQHVIDLNYENNRLNIQKLSDLINILIDDTLSTINRIEVNSYTSPEGGRIYNEKLSINRTNSIYNHIINRVSLPDSLIVKNNSGIDWDGLEVLVEASDMEYKEEVLNIIRTVPEETWKRVNPNDRWLTLVDSRNKHLMELHIGKPYRYMFANIYPKLRRGSLVSVSFTTIPPPPEPEPEPEPTPEPEPEPEPVVEPEPIYESKPLFAVKTNLLYDALSVINIELEIPIGNRWSIAGEWVFPWWTSCGNKSNSWQSSSSSRNTLEILNGNIEGKYWFGDRSTKPVMTGWNLGLYVGGGKYDLEYKAEGYQGEFFIAAGLSGGYAHTINKKGNLRMEYTLGIGLMQTDYRYYEEHWGIDDTWHTIRQYDGRYTWIGPTRARASLVWLLTKNKTK